MRIVLHDRVDGLGNRGDVVEVSDGYARNYLIPSGLAHQATPGAEAQAESMRRSWQLKNTQQREAAEEIAKTLVARPIQVTARAGPGGRLFGSVTTTDIAEAIGVQTGIEIDRRSLSLDEPIRSVGSHTVRAKPHPEVEFPVTVDVSAA
jgi:large subunit ribosomal protein L9